MTAYTSVISFPLSFSTSKGLARDQVLMLSEGALTESQGMYSVQLAHMLSATFTQLFSQFPYLSPRPYWPQGKPMPGKC